METFERARLDAYFSKIATQFMPDERVASFLVTHLLPERPGFVRAVAAMSDLRAVLPKPKSIKPVSCSRTPTPLCTTSNPGLRENRSPCWMSAATSRRRSLI